MASTQIRVDGNGGARWCAAIGRGGNGGGNQSETYEVSYSKRRLRWTRELHEQFVRAVYDLGGPSRATPKSILTLMEGAQGLALYQVKSHLQKFRLGKVSKRLDWRSNTRLPIYHALSHINEARLHLEGWRGSSISNMFDKNRSSYIFKTLGNRTYGNRHLLNEATFKNFQVSKTVSSAQTNEQVLGTSFMNFQVPKTLSSIQTNRQVLGTSFENFQVPETLSSIQTNRQVLLGTSSAPITSKGVINDCSSQWVNELLNGGGQQQHLVLPHQPTSHDNQNASSMFDDSMNSLGYSSSEFSIFITKAPDDQACMNIRSFFDDVASFNNVDASSSLYDYDTAT